MNNTGKKRLSQNFMELYRLTPFFERRQSRYCLDALAAVEFDVFVDQLSGLIKISNLRKQRIQY